MWSLNLKTFCRIYVLGLPNVSLSSMFTVENALEKGWESSKISRRVYVCNGLIVDGCQRNEISILQMSETYTRSPPKAEVKSISTTKKTSGIRFKPCMCCMLHVKKILNFLWNIRVFFLLFFCCPKTSHFFCLFRVRKVWKMKRFYFDSILQVYQHSCYEEDVAYRADFHSASCYLEISSVVSG